MDSVVIDSAEAVKHPLIDMGIEPCVTYSIEVKVINKVDIIPGSPVIATALAAGMFAKTHTPGPGFFFKNQPVNCKALCWLKFPPKSKRTLMSCK